MNLAWMVEYAVQTGQARIVIFEWLFPLTGLTALNPALTAVSSALSPFLRRLCLLRRGLPLLSLASNVTGLLVVLLLRAS